MNEEPIVNRVAKSPIITLDLADFHQQGERVWIDIQHQLFQGLILREKDFRDFVAQQDWSQYAGKYVAIGCSADAIIPVWAYMLLASRLTPFVRMLVFGDLQTLEDALFRDALSRLDVEAFRGRPVVIKGCGDISIPPSAYTEITRLLQPVVKSLMYGEPCSTVPVYKA